MAPLRAGQTTAPLAGLGIGRDRPRELRPGENLDVVVEHVLQELDWHYLAVRVDDEVWRLVGYLRDKELTNVFQSISIHLRQIKLEFLDARGGAGSSGGGAGDGPPRPMLKRFKFKVYNPVAITTTLRQVVGSGGGGGQPHHQHAEAEVGGERRRVLSCAALRCLPMSSSTDLPPSHIYVNKQVLIQAQVKNITERHTSLMLEDVAFVAEDGLIAEPLSSLDAGVNDASSGGPAAAAIAVSPSRIRRLALEDDDGGDDDGDGDDDPCDCVRAFDRRVYLQPDDVVQFIYRLRRAESYKGRAMVLAPGTPLGCVLARVPACLPACLTA